MRAIQCDRCRAFEGASASFAPEWEQRFNAEHWPRKLQSVRVRFSITPEGDPSGFGGLDLCQRCAAELFREAFALFAGGLGVA